MGQFLKKRAFTSTDSNNKAVAIVESGLKTYVDGEWTTTTDPQWVNKRIWIGEEPPTNKSVYWNDGSGIKSWTASNNSWTPIVPSKLQPNDEIWYTSSDGKIVTPYNETMCENIISNTYNNGKGIIKFDEDVVIIGYQAFYQCTNLISVTIPNSVTSIGEQAFGYSPLTSITIPNSVTSIGPYVFEACSLTSVSFNGTKSQWHNINKDTSWDSGLCTTMSNVVCTDGAAIPLNEIRYTTTNNGEISFDTTARFSLDDMYHESHTYNESTGIGIIKCEYNITYVGNDAFNGLSNLKSITLPDAVEGIGDYAFAYSDSLNYINIPSSVTSIGNGAFDTCYLITMTVEATVPPTLGTNALPTNISTAIYVPASSVDAYKAASGWSDYADKIQAIS